MPIADRKDMGARAIRSILNQQYPHFELIIVDDASKDGVDKMVEEFRKKDNRIKVVTHIQSMNRAISRNDGMDSCQ